MMEHFKRSSNKDHNQKDHNRMSKETYEIVKDYSEYSTIQGIIYIFQTNQTTFGKIFWTAVVAFMVLLGAYWSVKAYNSWQDNPVITTVGTTAFPVEDIEFPAVTICGQGNNEEVLSAGFLKMFSDHLKQQGINLGISPIKSSRILRKNLILVKRNLENFYLKQETKL